MNVEDEEEAAFLENELIGIVNFIIRPPRAKYTLADLGARQGDIGNVVVKRRDFVVRNKRDEELQCSIWEPEVDTKEELPCVIYLHGRGSCRLEALAIESVVLPYRMKLVGMDFSGSGLSDGEFVSLGLLEKDDVAALIDHLVTSRMASRIALWGHSMGAATAIMYSGSKPKHTISCAVLDSSYSSFEKLAENTVKTNVQPLPRQETAKDTCFPFSKHLPYLGERDGVTISLMSAGMSWWYVNGGQVGLPAGVQKKLLLTIGVRKVRKMVKDKAGFDLGEVQPVKSAKDCKHVPCVIIHGTDDDAVSYSDGVAIHEAYGCLEKELLTIKGGNHDSTRPVWVEDKAFILLQKHLTTSMLEFCRALKLRGNGHLLKGAYSDAITIYSIVIDMAQEVVLSEVPPTSPKIMSGLQNSVDGKKQLLKSMFRKKDNPGANPTNTPFKKKLPGLSFVKKEPQQGGNLEGRFLQNSPSSILTARSSSRHVASHWTPLTEVQKETLTQILPSVFGNRSLSFASLNIGEKALEDADKVVELSPHWPRGYQRQAYALQLKGRYDEAIASIQHGIALDPTNKALKELRDSIQQQQQQQQK